jgi:hypothetical protein
MGPVSAVRGDVLPEDRLEVPLVEYRRVVETL